MTTKLGDLFTVTYGHSLELNRLELSDKENGIAFISRKMGHNGVAAYVKEIPTIAPHGGGNLTCALSGNGILSSFIQDSPYYTGFHIACLTPKTSLNKAQLLFYCTCITANRYKFSWGRQANRTLRDITLPSITEIPTWVENANTAMYSGTDTPAINKTPAPINQGVWKTYELQHLFEIKKGKRLTKSNMIKGELPYIGSTDSNNGITAFIGQKAIHLGNTISVAYNGSVAETFYQPSEYWATDDVNVLYPKFEMTPSIALFLCTLIRLEKYRYNYGRKWHLERMRESQIRLPAKEDGTPDWDFMSNYIKSLPFSSQI